MANFENILENVNQSKIKIFKANIFLLQSYQSIHIFNLYCCSLLRSESWQLPELRARARTQAEQIKTCFFNLRQSMCWMVSKIKDSFPTDSFTLVANFYEEQASHKSGLYLGLTCAGRDQGFFGLARPFWKANFDAFNCKATLIPIFQKVKYFYWKYCMINKQSG